MHRITERIEMHQPPAIGLDLMGWRWQLARPQAATDRMRLGAVPCDVIDPPTDRMAAAILGVRLALREGWAA